MIFRRNRERLKSEEREIPEANAENVVEEGKSIERTVLEYAVTIVICVAMALLIRSYVITRADVDGVSMSPTLRNKDVVFVEKISTIREKYGRGSIVIFDAHTADEDVYIKRVIAVAGEEILIKNGKVYVNGEELKEGYLPEGTVTNGKSFLAEGINYIVPEGCIFVMGDNRGSSEDSRAFGPVKVKDVKGRAIIRVFPLKKLKFL